MAKSSWTAFAEVDPSKEYIAVLSYLPLKTLWALPQFLYYTRSIQRQLKTARGVIGYSLSAHVLAKRFWTLSVWQDEVSLMDFIHKPPHRETMAVLRRFMGGTEFVSWKMRGASVPPSLDEAMERSHLDEARQS